MRKGAVALLLCSLIIPDASAAAQRPKWADAVDSIVQRELARTGTPGGQVAIVERGRLAYASGYGVADAATGRPATERTLFQVSGVTKLFTAALIAEMHARGALDLDSPVRRYIPEMPGPRTGAATLRSLLSMSAGWINTADPRGTSDERELSSVFSAVGDTIVMTDAGRVYSYSNPGFNVAGLVTERVARRPFAELLDSLLFRPLGVSNASFRPTVVAQRDFSQAHAAPAGQPARVQPPPGNAREWPAGFLYASASDIARLAIALMADGVIDGRRVLAAEALRQMRRPVIPVPEVPGDSAALGMHVMVTGGRRVWTQTGSIPGGFESQVDIWPDDGFAVVASFNRQNAVPASVIEAIALRVAGIRPRPSVSLEGERDATAEERAALVGRYGQTVPTSTYFEEDGKLMMRLANVVLPVRLTADGARIIVRPANGPMRITTIVRDSTGAIAFLVREGRAYRKQ